MKKKNKFNKIYFKESLRESAKIGKINVFLIKFIQIIMLLEIVNSEAMIKKKGYLNYSRNKLN